MRQFNFLAEENRLTRLSEMGDQLEKMRDAIDWERFREGVEAPFIKETKGAGGRPPFDKVMMFKIIMLQEWYNISDDAVEYQINDRLSFQRFLGLGLNDRVPDAKTIWLFRETLRKAGADTVLFDLFRQVLQEAKLITRSGSIVDAVFAECPRQHNTKEENKQIKNGTVPEGWEKNKRQQKDCDARWTRKRGAFFFGFKNHIKVDRSSKLITKSVVTPASTHDSVPLEKLVDETDQAIYGDSAYDGKKTAKRLRKAAPKATLHIHKKANRNHPLTEDDKLQNREKSRVRCRVEHVFGHMKNSMGGTFIRCIGFERATCRITLKNLAYNLHRYEFLTRPPPSPSMG